MLIEKLKTVDINIKQARNYVDVLVVKTATAESEDQNTPDIVGENINILVILIESKYPIASKRNFLKKNDEANMDILFLYAFSGCDTTSALFNKRKILFIKTFEKLSNFYQLAVFQ